MKPHKHSELIKAWADGAEIQIKNSFGDWVATDPLWSEHYEYRIKPAEKVVRWLWVFENPVGWDLCSRVMSEAEIQANKDLYPSAKYKKLEWSREEFDE